MSGLKKIHNAGNFSARNIHERLYQETLPDGRSVEVVVRVPMRDGAPAAKVNGIVFFAPYPREKLRTARSFFANALVVRLGCAVVSISVEGSDREVWDQRKSYVYPASDVFGVVEKAVAETRRTYGEAGTPLVALGYSAGGVMAMYLAQSATFGADAVVAFEQSQGEDNTPGQYAVRIPALIINPEDSPWNARVARRHAEAVDQGAPMAFCVARPIVDVNPQNLYYRKAGGRYANDLAYCFIRDVIDAKAAGEWPARWAKRNIRIEAPGQAWEREFLGTSEDFAQLYALLGHGTYEALASGECAYGALPPFFRKRAVLLVKKGVWSYQDQVRFGAVLVHHGCANVICSVPDDAAAGRYLPAQLSKLKATGLEVTVVSLVEPGDEKWTDAVIRSTDGTPCVFVERGEALRLPDREEPRMRAVFTARPDFDPQESFQSALFEETTWMNPLDFEALVRFLAPIPTPAPAKLAEKKSPARS